MSFQKNARLVAMSRYAEASFGAGVTPNATAPTSHIQLLADRDASKSKIGLTILDNSNQATGEDEATETYQGKRSASMPIGMDLDDEHLPRLCLAHFGGIAQSTLAAAAGGLPVVTQQIITRLNRANSLQLPSYEFVDYLPGSQLDRRLESCVSQELKLTIINDDATQRMKMSQTWIGSGRVRRPSNLIWSPTSGYHVQKSSGRHYFTGLHAALRIGDYDGSGAGQNVVDYADCTVRKIEATFTNVTNENESYCPGAGQYFYSISGSGTAILWKASTAHALNAYVVFSGRVYKVTDIGSSPNQSGASGPTHTSGAVTNGDLELTFVNFNGIAAFGASTPVVLSEYVAYSDRLYKVTIAGTTHATTVPTHTSGTASNGTATLKFIIVMSESGAVAGQQLQQSRSSALQIVVDAKADSPFNDDLDNQKKLDLVFGAVGRYLRPGYRAQMLFHLYQITWKVVDEVDLNDFLRYTLEPLVQLDQAQGKVLDVTCQNSALATEYIAA